MPEIRGDQIKDGSLTGADVQDGSIDLADLSNEVKSQLSGGGSWRAPIALQSNLPLSSNSIGDVILTLDTMKIWIWDGTVWKDLLENVMVLNPDQ